MSRSVITLSLTQPVTITDCLTVSVSIHSTCIVQKEGLYDHIQKMMDNAQPEGPGVKVTELEARDALKSSSVVVQVSRPASLCVVWSNLRLL